ncbi:hypothetical protein Btru_076950, partial [Bulinus truncatus]
VYPADPFKFIGETLELYCNITNTHKRENSSSLYFEKLPLSSNKYIQEDLKENFVTLVPLKKLEILTTKTIRLRIDNVQTSDNGKYICSLKTYHTAQIIGYQIVKVDYRPGKVSNFTCKVFNWESMICTWKLGIHYVHNDNIKISLVYTYDGTQNDCPNLTSTSCIWPKEYYYHGHLYYIKVVVSTVNKNIVLAFNESEQYRIETQLYVQPAPVDRFKAQVINSSCVNLTWDHSAKSREKIYKAYYTSNNKMREILLVDEEVNNYYALVCHLTAFTSYKFQIAVLPQPVQTEAETQGFLSEWRHVEANTSEDVPASAPEICSGCYYDVACSQNKSSNNRCIQLFWKDLNAAEKRGEITEYKVTTETKSRKKIFNRLRVYVNKHKHLSTAEIYFQEVENAPTEISLTPGTMKGFSEKSSFLIVPSKSKSPKPPNNFLVEREKLNNGTYHYYISWAALHSSHKMVLKYKSVTIVWCYRTSDKKCHKNVHWAVLDSDSVTYELTLKVQDLLIGISAQVEDDGYTLSSGTTWADCIYMRNQVPHLPPKNVKISSAHSLLKNSLHIVWQNFQCLEDASYVLEYLIKYCPTFEGLACNGEYCPTFEGLACNDAEKTENVSNHKNEVTLRNLKGNTKYKLQIIAVSAAGLGPPSETFIFDVMEAAPESDTTWVTVIVVVFVLLISIMSIVTWRCYKMCLKSSDKFQEIDIASNPGSEILHRNTDDQSMNTNVSKTENKDIHSPLPAPMNTTDKSHEIRAENGVNDSSKSDVWSPAITNYIKFGSCDMDQHPNEPLAFAFSDCCKDTLQIRNCSLEVWNLHLEKVSLVSPQYSTNFPCEKHPKETISSKASTFPESTLLPEMVGDDNFSGVNHQSKYTGSVDTVSISGDYIDFSYVNINELPGSLFSQPARFSENVINSGELQLNDSENMSQLDNSRPSTCPSYFPHDNVSSSTYCTISRAKHLLPCDVYCPQGEYIESTSPMLSQSLPYCQCQACHVGHISTPLMSEPDTHSPALTCLDSSCDNQQHPLVFSDSDLRNDNYCSPSHSTAQSSSVTCPDSSSEDSQHSLVLSDWDLSHPPTHSPSITCLDSSSIHPSAVLCDLNLKNHSSTRPLSGILLHLPPRYYVHPDNLHNSSQLLTEL